MNVSLSLSDGLTGETVHRVMTDKSGITWIATNSGVNAFNGGKLHSFRISDQQNQYQSVFDVCEVNGEVIYAAAEKGLYRLKKGLDYFERVLPEIEHPLCLYARGGTLYIGSQQGIHIYDGNELKHVDVDVSRKGLNNIVRQYASDGMGRIWFLGRYGLNCYEPLTGKIKSIPIGIFGKQLALTQFAYADETLLVVGTKTQGLYVCNIETRKAERIEGVGNIVSSVQRSSDGSICVACDGAGAYRLEVKDKKLHIVERFHTEGDDSHRLPSNGVYCYYRDSYGVNWFGLVRYGLAYTYHVGNLFKPFQMGDFSSQGINVRTFFRHGDEMVIGTQKGFYYIDAATGQTNYYSPEDLGGGHIVNTVVWYDGLFYIGMFDGGLRLFDPQTKTIRQQSFSPLLDEGSIGDLKVGPGNQLWIGSTNGLFIVNENDSVVKHYAEQNSHIVGGLILSITFDAAGNAWITGANGCSLYSAKSHEIVEANFPEGFFDKQPWMRGAVGHDGLIFMRTGPQTFYTNEKMTDYGELHLPVAFADKWIRNFVDDMHGHYLLASERGVFCFDYDLKETMHFGYGEGLLGDFINDMTMDQDGVLWVSTSQGLFSSTLAELSKWSKETCYKVRLLNIRKGSDLMPMNEEYSANETYQINISWNFTSEVLQMHALLSDYAKQTGRLYQYRLDGGNWQLVDDGQPMDIRGLSLGKHKLQVRLAGAEGTTSVFTISVMPKVLLAERDAIEDALIESEELRMKSEEFKYQKVKVDEQECAEIVSRMKDYIERERVYTNADLKMKDLADVLHLSAPKLSQVFNLYLGQNYYDFINDYRLAEFKRLIDEGEYKRYTIIALSEQCGFKKSNFFSTFRKVEGVTPTEYLKKKGLKVG